MERIKQDKVRSRDIANYRFFVSRINCELRFDDRATFPLRLHIHKLTGELIIDANSSRACRPLIVAYQCNDRIAPSPISLSMLNLSTELSVKRVATSIRDDKDATREDSIRKWVEQHRADGDSGGGGGRIDRNELHRSNGRPRFINI